MDETSSLTYASGEPVRFFVPGRPRPKGSFRAVPIRTKAGWATRANGSPKVAVLHDASGTREWVDSVRLTAKAALATIRPIFLGPVALELTFVLERPRSHRKPDGTRRKSSPTHPFKKPDLDKLVRSVLDGLTGAVYRDDAQVVEVVARKEYVDEVGDSMGVFVAAREVWG